MASPSLLLYYQTDEFELRLLSLNKISKILLGHSSFGRGHGWYCQQVSISSISPRGDKMETLFLCNRWFDTGVGDRQTVCEFSAVGTVSLKDVVAPTRRATANGVWNCYIKMANMESLDFSHLSHDASNVACLFVYGSKGVSGPLKVESGKNGSLRPGKTYSFKGLTIGAIGDLTKLRINCISKDGGETVWAIKEVLLENTKTGEKLQFNFSRHIGQISEYFSQEMPVLRPGTEIPPLVKYLVKVETADAPVAGTSAKVYATLYGPKGDSGQRLLQTSVGLRQFKSGEELTFEIEAVDLGNIDKLVVTKGPGDPWLLKQITVKAGPFGPTENLFTWNQWIGEDEKRDQEVEIILQVESSRPSSVAIPINEFPDFPVTRGHWSVEVHTGPSGATADASDVVIIFCGKKQESSPVSLSQSKNNSFQPSSQDHFELRLTEDVGELIKIRLGFEDTTKHKKLHLQKIKFEDNDTKDTFSYALSECLTVSDVSDGWLEFPVIWPGAFILPIVKYTITVEIGDLLKPGPINEILINIDGQMGSTGFRLLKDKFIDLHESQKGQITRSVIEAVSLMTLISVTIGHTNKQPGNGWFLSRVIIRESDENKDYVFVCNRWLDAGQEDGETFRTLFYNNHTFSADTKPITRFMHVPLTQTVNSELQENKEKPATPKSRKAFAYNVTTMTGKLPGNGVVAQLVLILYGDKGHSESLIIAEDGPVNLKEGENQQFQISTDVDLGDLYKVRVGFNASGYEQRWYSDLNSCPAWFVQKLKIKDRNTDKDYVAVAKQWVRMEADHDFWREFPVKGANSHETLFVKNYFIDVYTGQIMGAGTSANVYMQLFGQNGDTGWRHLHGSKINQIQFETGAHDLFMVNAVDLGTLTKVGVKHDGHNAGEGWYLDKIEVKESETSSVVYLFHCDRWLDKGKDDGATERELDLSDTITKNEIPQTNEDMQQEKEQPKASEWQVHITTSNLPGSGTDANVTFTVVGSRSNTGPIHLGTENQNCFQTGMTDEFNIKLDQSDIGEIKKIRLEHDNSGRHSDWRVDELVLEDLYSGQKYSFAVNRCLSDKEKDGDIVFEGAVSTLDKPPMKVRKYLVKTVTEAEEDAGTDANVFINIIGTEGDCGKRFLRHNIDGSKKFASGKTNSFLIEAVDLGDIEQIVIGHDGVGPESSWKLLCVMIRPTDSNIAETCVFPCGKWITGICREVTILKGAMHDSDETEM